MSPSAKIVPGPHWWRASALTTRPTLPPRSLQNGMHYPYWLDRRTTYREAEVKQRLNQYESPFFALVLFMMLLQLWITTGETLGKSHSGDSMIDWLLASSNSARLSPVCSEFSKIIAVKSNQREMQCLCGKRNDAEYPWSVLKHFEVFTKRSKSSKDHRKYLQPEL